MVQNSVRAVPSLTLEMTDAAKETSVTFKSRYSLTDVIINAGHVSVYLLLGCSERCKQQR